MILPKNQPIRFSQSRVINQKPKIFIVCVGLFLKIYKNLQMYQNYIGSEPPSLTDHFGINLTTIRPLCSDREQFLWKKTHVTLKFKIIFYHALGTSLEPPSLTDHFGIIFTQISQLDSAREQKQCFSENH